MPSPEPATRISESTLSYVKQYAGGGGCPHQVRLVTVAKDNSGEEHLALIGSMYDDSTGRGPQLHRHLRSFIAPESPRLGTVGSNTVCQLFGLLVNFWNLLLHHFECVLHMLYLSRYLRVVNPAIICTWSSPISELFFRHSLSLVWSLISLSDQAMFMAGKSGQFLNQFLAQEGHRETLPSPGGESYSK